MNKCFKSPATKKYPCILGRSLDSFPLKWNEASLCTIVCVCHHSQMAASPSTHRGRKNEVYSPKRQYVITDSDYGSVPW